MSSTPSAFSTSTSSYISVPCGPNPISLTSISSSQTPSNASMPTPPWASTSTPSISSQSEYYAGVITSTFLIFWSFLLFYSLGASRRSLRTKETYYRCKAELGLWARELWRQRRCCSQVRRFAAVADFVVRDSGVSDSIDFLTRVCLFAVSCLIWLNNFICVMKSLGSALIL